MSFMFPPPMYIDGWLAAQPFNALVPCPPPPKHKTLLKDEHRFSNARRRGPMDEMRQLLRILVKLVPESSLYAPGGGASADDVGGGSNRVSEDQIKAFFRAILAPEAPQPVWGLPDGWGSYVAELVTWLTGREITRHEAMQLAQRPPGRSWQVVDEELERLGLFPASWPVPLERERVMAAQATAADALKAQRIALGAAALPPPPLPGVPGVPAVPAAPQALPPVDSAPSIYSASTTTVKRKAAHAAIGRPVKAPKALPDEAAERSGEAEQAGAPIWRPKPQLAPFAAFDATEASTGAFVPAPRHTPTALRPPSECGAVEAWGHALRYLKRAACDHDDLSGEEQAAVNKIRLHMMALLGMSAPMPIQVPVPVPVPVHMAMMPQQLAPAHLPPPHMAGPQPTATVEEAPMAVLPVADAVMAAPPAPEPSPEAAPAAGKASHSLDILARVAGQYPHPPITLHAQPALPRLRNANGRA